MWIKASVSEFREQQDVVNNQVRHFLQHIDLLQLPTPAVTETTIGEVNTILPIKTITLFRNHMSILLMWNEWFGLDDFKSDFPGGIEDLEMRGN